MGGESSDESDGSDGSGAAVQAVVEVQPQEWVDGRAVSARDSVKFRVPIADATDDDGVLLVDDTYGSDELAEHPNAPEWVQEWEGPFYVTVGEIVADETPESPPMVMLFEAKPETSEKRSCDGCNMGTFDRFLLASSEEAAKAEREHFEEEHRNGFCANCMMDLLMGKGLFSDGKHQILQQ